MNAIAEPVFGTIPLNLVRPSPTNPRKTFDPVKLQELAESIKQVGVGQAILVRPHPDQEANPQCVEIVAGERRYRASMIAGVETIPAIVRNMSDLEVIEFQLIENIQRADVNEFEEAEGFRNLMSQFAKTADEIAERISQSRSYVFGRLKLLNLPETVRGICSDKHINASTALLIARIPTEKLQEQAAREIATNSGRGEPMSYRAAKEHLQQRYTLDLNTAIFNISDAKLIPVVGNCTTCPNRSGNQPEIYSDMSADVCTSPDCFESKKKAHYAEIERKAIKKGTPIVEAASVYHLTIGDNSKVSSVDALWKMLRVIENPHRKLYDVLTSEQMPEPVNLVKTGDRLVAIYDCEEVQKALEKAGICRTVKEQEAFDAQQIEQQANDPEAIKKQAADQARREKHAARIAIAKIETDIRVAAYKRVRTNAINQDGLSVPVLRAVLKFILTNEYDSLPGQLLSDLYPFDASDDDALSAYIDSAKAPQLEALLLDHAVRESLEVREYDLDDNDAVEVEENDETYKLFELLTTYHQVDMASIRLELTPAPAAPKKTNACFKKKKLASDEGSEVAPIDPTSEFLIDDVVRVKDDARGPNNKKRKVAGKIGVVIIEGDRISVRFGPQSHDLVTNLTASELEKTDQEKPDWWQKWKDSMTAAWPFPTGAV